jgi:copper chaperone
MSEEAVTQLAIRGMSCGNCVKHVEHALRSVPGVTEVQVDLSRSEARVTHAGVTLDALSEAVREAGYEAG